MRALGLSQPSIRSLPLVRIRPGETVEIEVSGPLVATTAESWVISGRLPDILA